MLDDAFKLTLDVLYPALKGDQLPESAQDEAVSNEKFSVDGYADDYNMWG